MSIFKKYIENDLDNPTNKTKEISTPTAKKILLIIIPIFSIPIIFVTLILLFKSTIWKDEKIEGASSPSSQYKVHALVRNRGHLPGSNYYTDIIICNNNGLELSKWIDTNGQGSDKKANEVLNSVHWIDSNTIEFSTNTSNSITLSTPKK